MKKAVRHIIGWFFIVLGIIGLFLPILQGILFILVGMFILARDIPFFHNVLCRLEERYPVIFGKAKCLHVDVSNWCRKKITIFDKCGKNRDGHGEKN